MEHPEGGERTSLETAEALWIRMARGRPMPFNEFIGFASTGIAYREFTRNPDLPDTEFKKILGAEILGPGQTTRPPAICSLFRNRFSLTAVGGRLRRC